MKRTPQAPAVLVAGSSVEPRLVIADSLKSPSSIFSLHNLASHAASYCFVSSFAKRLAAWKSYHIHCPARVGSLDSRTQFPTLPPPSFPPAIPWESHLFDPLLISASASVTTFPSLPLPYLSSAAVSTPSSCRWSLSPFSYPLRLTHLPPLSCYIVFSLLWLISPALLREQPTTYCVYHLSRILFSIWSPNWLPVRAL